MAGIYVHIPFCASRCIYCGFYSTTRGDLRQRYVDAVCREWKIRASYLKDSVHTIYIGGGTPSQLSSMQLRQLFDALGVKGKTGESPAPFEDALGCNPVEVTLECNPDDLTEEYAAALSLLPVNRVSMGVQTFDDGRLRFLRRRHTASQIPTAVERLRQAGIENISIDLMYGFPDETLADWHRDIDRALALGVEHLSAYALSYEEGTPLYHLLQQGKIQELDEELSLQMYSDLIDRLTAAGYEHYEISNFARLKVEDGESKKDSYRSRHNSSYWHQVPYLGLGAAAHSYDGHSRQWNIDDVEQYIEGIEQGRIPFEREELDADTCYDELVMTALRTCEGLDTRILSEEDRQYCLSQAKRFLNDGLLTLDNSNLRLTRKGLFVSNMIMSELMKAT